MNICTLTVTDEASTEAKHDNPHPKPASDVFINYNRRCPTSSDPTISNFIFTYRTGLHEGGNY